VLSPEQLGNLKNVTPDVELFDGDASKFRLSVEARRLKWAHEYDLRPELGENWVVKLDILPATYTRKQGMLLHVFK